MENISFSIIKGSFVSIFGKNAAGKTTLLNIISGLDIQTSGELSCVEDLNKIKVSYIFQNYAESLFPWKNVFENISLPLKLRGISKKECMVKVLNQFEKYKIELDLKKYPYQLSGGQKQITAILRALIVEPDLLLLDEPSSALDFSKKLYLHSILLEIWEQTHTTIIFISHDLDEAIYLADKVILLGGNPTTVILEQEINIERPRYLKLLASEKFNTIKSKLINNFIETTNNKNLWKNNL